MSSAMRTGLLVRGPFVVALVTLLANDHVLKGSGWLPGWVTGKLSDFAGLYVAALLLAVLARAHSRWSRALCCLAVGAGFSAINLWPGAAELYTTVLQVIGIRARVWLDPTDLVALPVLAVAYMHLSDAYATVRRPSGLRPPSSVSWSGRLLVAVAAFACIATSALPERPQGPVLISNLQDRELSVEVMVLPDDCPEVPPECGHLGVGDEGGEALASEESRLLAPFSHEALDGRSCGRILLSVEDYVAEIAWTGLCLQSVGYDQFVEHSEQGITVERAGDEIVVTVGEALEETRL